MLFRSVKVVMTDGGHVRGLVQVPNTRLAVLVRYLQSDQLYYLVLGIAISIQDRYTIAIHTSYTLLWYRVCPRHPIVPGNLQAT